MLTILGYIGTVITLSAVFVWWILSRPERFNLDEESEALRECKEPKNGIKEVGEIRQMNNNGGKDV